MHNTIFDNRPIQITNYNGETELPPSYFAGILYGFPYQLRDESNHPSYRNNIKGEDPHELFNQQYFRYITQDAPQLDFYVDF